MGTVIIVTIAIIVTAILIHNYYSGLELVCGSEACINELPMVVAAELPGFFRAP